MTQNTDHDVTRRNFLYGLSAAGTAMGAMGIGGSELFAKGDDLPKDAGGNIIPGTRGQVYKLL